MIASMLWRKRFAVYGPSSNSWRSIRFTDDGLLAILPQHAAAEYSRRDAPEFFRGVPLIHELPRRIGLEPVYIVFVHGGYPCHDIRVTWLAPGKRD